MNVRVCVCVYAWEKKYKQKKRESSMRAGKRKAEIEDSNNSIAVFNNRI